MNRYTGIAASNGIVIGEITVINRTSTGYKRVTLPPHREKKLFESALEIAKDEVKLLIENADGDHKDILMFQFLLLSDEGLLESIYEKIKLDYGAAHAVEVSMEEYCQQIKDIGDDYFIHRTYDIRDVLGRIVHILDGTKRDRFILEKPCVIVTEDILPSDLSQIQRDKAQGFVTVGGAYQSHSNIIARTMEIPSVFGVSNDVLNPLNNGKTIVLDASKGEVIINPTESVLALYKHKLKQQQKASDGKFNEEIISPSGKKINLYANCDDPFDIQKSIDNSLAEGIGLVRSEILFFKESTPNFKDQIIFYENCIKASEDKPIYIRTFDIGADKTAHGISLNKEPNPALGMRGVRLKKLFPDLFLNQIRALYIAANNTKKINVMLPMVTTEHDVIDYLDSAKEVLNKLLMDGLVTKDNIDWGVMIEVPSAALISDKLARHVKFFSIGTNDLTQYTTATDRVNHSVAAYYDFMNEGVMKLIEIVIASAKTYNIPVSICGESASIFEIADKYIEMGVDTLSMAQGSLPPLRKQLWEKYNKK